MHTVLIGPHTGTVATVGLAQADNSNDVKMMVHFDMAVSQSRSCEDLHNFPGSYSPSRLLHHYMNDQWMHPAMEQDVNDRFQGR